MQLLVDGHNLIGAMPDIKLSEADDEEKLILKLRRYRARTGRRVTVFFDAGLAFNTGQKKSQGGLSIQFAPHGTTADALIIKRLRRARNPREVLVITADRAIQQVARQTGARVMASAQFAQELETLALQPAETDDVQLSDAEIDEWLSLFNQESD